MNAQVWMGALFVVGAFVVRWWTVTATRGAGDAGRARLQAGLGPVPDLRRLELARPARDRLVRASMESVARKARRLTPQGWTDALERRIGLAGISHRWSLDRVLSVKLMLGALGVALALVTVASNPSRSSVFLGLVLVIATWLLPEAWLSRLGRARQAEIEHALPDVLDQITIAVEAGLGFDAALARSVRTGNGALAEEFGRALSEIRAGLPRDAAFRNIVERTEVPDLRHFVVSIEQASRHGIPIAKVLRVQAQELRDKRRQRAEEAAQKIPMKVVFPTVFCILPALFIVILGPAVFRLADTFGG
jgi:tight adherence protein C